MRKSANNDLVTALEKNTAVIVRLTESIEKMLQTLTDHEIRITKLESK